MPGPLHKLVSISRFAAFRLTGRRVPLAVYWKITWRCNLSCDYCGVSTRRGPELPTPTLVRLLEEAAAAGVYRVTLSGGEPLMQRDLGTLIRTLTARGVSVGLDSNGALVPQRMDALRGISDATISLDGGPRVHDAQRGDGSHAAAVAGVEALRRAGVPVVLASVITARNHADVDAVLDAAADLGAVALFQPATPWRHDSTLPNPLSPERDQLLEAFARLRRHRHAGRLANTRAYMDSFQAWPRMPRLPCPGGRVAAVVNPDGRVGCCDFDVPPDPWRDGVEFGFAEAFAALPAPPPCDRCSCATTASVQRALTLEPGALLDLLRRT
ncbi:MAG: radical SAM protein [Pseudomonadota bacterium]